MKKELVYHRTPQAVLQPLAVLETLPHGTMIGRLRAHFRYERYCCRSCHRRGPTLLNHVAIALGTQLHHLNYETVAVRAPVQTMAAVVAKPEPMRRRLGRVLDAIEILAWV
jgi:hypothetical protein